MKPEFLESIKDQIIATITRAKEINVQVVANDKAVNPHIANWAIQIAHTGTVSEGETPSLRRFSFGVTVMQKIPTGGTEEYDIIGANQILAVVEEVKGALREFAFGETVDYVNLTWNSQSGVENLPYKGDAYIYACRTTYSGAYFEL